MTFGAVTAQLGALTAAYGENLSSERSVTSLEGSRAIATFSVQAPFKAAVTKIVVGWLETAGSGASIASPGRCSRVVQKRKVGAFFDCFRRSCSIRGCAASFPAFLFFRASWHPGFPPCFGWITMHEGWAPATRDQVFVDFSGSPRTLFRGVLHTLQESGASVTSKPTTDRIQGRRFVLAVGSL